MIINLLEDIQKSLKILELEYVTISNQKIIRILGENYGLIQIEENNQGFRIVKILEKNNVDSTVLKNLDCINFDLEIGKYYMLDNELWFEICIYNDNKLTQSMITDAIYNFCNAPSLLRAS